MNWRSLCSPLKPTGQTHRETGGVGGVLGGLPWRHSIAILEHCGLTQISLEGQPSTVRRWSLIMYAAISSARGFTSLLEMGHAR